MTNTYSRRRFIRETGKKVAVAGTAAVFSGANVSSSANAAQMSSMNDGSAPNAVAFGQSLKGVGFNLLVTDVEKAAAFSTDILHAEIVYSDASFAILKHGDFQWMLHLDQTYRNNPLSGLVEGVEGRGRGVELRLYDQDPDAAELRAKESNYTVLAASANKPHGLRECYILDPDGYCWAIGRDLKPGE